MPPIPTPLPDLILSLTPRGIEADWTGAIKNAALTVSPSYTVSLVDNTNGNLVDRAAYTGTTTNAVFEASTLKLQSGTIYTVTVKDAAGRAVGEDITYIPFQSRPRRTVNRDVLTGIAIIAALAAVIGLLICFFVKHKSDDRASTSEQSKTSETAEDVDTNITPQASDKSSTGELPSFTPPATVAKKPAASSTNNPSRMVIVKNRMSLTDDQIAKIADSIAERLPAAANNNSQGDIQVVVNNDPGVSTTVDKIYQGCPESFTVPAKGTVIIDVEPGFRPLKIAPQAPADRILRRVNGMTFDYFAAAEIKRGERIRVGQVIVKNMEDWPVPVNATWAKE